MEKCRLKLVKLTSEYKNQLFEMMDEWTSYIKRESPSVIFLNDYHDFDYYMNNLDIKEASSKYVPSTTYFALDIKRNIFVGAISIRHYLNDDLLLYGGHIGDGIRPSERRKGYATEMIHLALKECKKLGLDNVLITCNKDNIGSRKSIINNGGIKENEVIEDDEILERYWIKI